MPLSEAQRERVLSVLSKGPALRLAVLFGSRATGRERDESDYDIGILPVDPAVTLHRELELASALSGALSAEVDVVRLDECPPLLGAEVARHGECIFESSPGAFAAFRAEAISQWLDFEETVAPHRENMLRRLRGGATP